MAKTTNDYSNLSIEELEKCKLSIQNAINEKKTQKKSEVLSSPEAKALVKELKLLQKEANKLESTNFSINVPIKITIKPHAPDILNYYGSVEEMRDIFDVFDIDYVGTLEPSHSFTNKQKSLLKFIVRDTIKDACEDIQKLVPEENIQHINDFVKKVESLFKKMEKCNIEYEDLSEQIYGS